MILEDIELPRIIKYVKVNRANDSWRVPDDDLVILTHIMKTAGTTLDRIMHRAARSRNEVWHRVNWQGHHSEGYTKLQQTPRDILRQARYLTGHLPYGIHEGLSRNAFYVTLLREPIKRLVSHYVWGIQRDRWSVDDTISTLHDAGVLYDNMQVRHITGNFDTSTPCNERMLQQAIRILRENYGLVGITEQFDSFLQKLIVLLDWPDILYTNYQYTTKRLNPEATAIVTQQSLPYVEYDLLLYEEACKLQSRQVERQGLVSARRTASSGSLALLVSPHVHVKFDADGERYLLSLDEAGQLIEHLKQAGVTVEIIQ